MSQPAASNDLLSSLGALAERLAERRLFAEAREVYETALRIAPEDDSLRAGLALARRRQLENGTGDSQGQDAALLERLRRDAIDAAQLAGLAHLYVDRDELDKAGEYLDLAARKRDVDPLVNKLRARVLLRRKRFEPAAKALRSARRFDPFDCETADLLSRAELELRRYDQALAAAVDAYLLIDSEQRSSATQLQQRIKELRGLLRYSKHQLSAVFHQRRELLQTLLQRLEPERLQPRVERQRPSRTVVREHSRLELARRMRKIALWSGLSDEEVFELAGTASAELHPKGSQIFAYRTQGADIYLLESGRVAVMRPTSYGRFELGQLRDGDVFGEVNFISRSERSGDAVARTASHLLRLDGEALHRLIDRRPELGLNVYLSFWRDLAQKLRNTNEQLRTFFAPDSGNDSLLRLSRDRDVPDSVDVEDTDKVELFLEQGLSGDELTILTELSRVQRFAAGSHLFHEGDPGSEMYVVLEGKVAISKFIPGGGEEALAVLRRGEFFGEMSLIDGEPRSADARALDGAVTVVALDQRSLSSVMSMDPPAALAFMRLLCGLICRRLREIDEKVTAWRIMSGGRSVADRGSAQRLSRRLA